jgi:DNA primase small subunit
LTRQKLVFTYLYPRIDANVSKGINHLLKSPFVIHPKTGKLNIPQRRITPSIGKVCVPFDPAKVDQFDVNRSVPTLNMVIGDLSKTAAGGGVACMEAPLAVFKKFIEKIRAENVRSAK